MEVLSCTKGSIILSDQATLYVIYSLSEETILSGPIAVIVGIPVKKNEKAC